MLHGIMLLVSPGLGSLTGDVMGMIIPPSLVVDVGGTEVSGPLDTGPLDTAGGIVVTWSPGRVLDTPVEDIAVSSFPELVKEFPVFVTPDTTAVMNVVSCVDETLGLLRETSVVDCPSGTVVSTPVEAVTSSEVDIVPSEGTCIMIGHSYFLSPCC